MYMRRIDHVLFCVCALVYQIGRTHSCGFGVCVLLLGGAGLEVDRAGWLYRCVCVCVCVCVRDSSHHTLISLLCVCAEGRIFGRNGFAADLESSKEPLVVRKPWAVLQARY